VTAFGWGAPSVQAAPGSGDPPPRLGADPASPDATTPKRAGASPAVPGGAPARAQDKDSVRAQDKDSARAQDKDSARAQDKDSARAQDKDSARAQDKDSARAQDKDSARAQDKESAKDSGRESAKDSGRDSTRDSARDPAKGGHSSDPGARAHRYGHGDSHADSHGHMRGADPQVEVGSQPQPQTKAKRPWYRFEASLEMGFVAPLYHKYQQGADGTYFDFRAQGGQENLFLFLRTSAGIRFVDRHVVLFLYQPLTLKTQQTLQEDVRLEGIDFPAGTPVNLKYGFDFYRVSYMYDIFRSPRFELGVGASLQIRNADIAITSADGGLRAISQNVGPVPLLKVRGRYTFDSGWWIGLEVDGIYATSKIINGSSRDVTGALLDASLRAGIHLEGFVDVFVNLRYLGGGAEDGGDPVNLGNDYSRNWLHFLTLSLGLGIY